MPKVTIISDTHNQHESLTLDPCDILIHCGDATNRSNLQEYLSFAVWFKKQDAKHRIFVPGNHDWSTMGGQYYIIKETLGPTVHFLIADYIEIEGLKIFGSAREGYERCPEDIDILITHEPPSCILDEVPAFSKFNSDPHPLHLGSTSLLAQITDRIKPRYHLFGHIHEHGGEMERYKNTTFINAAVLDEYYVMARPTGISIFMLREENVTKE